jgi:hypothetical protein
MTRHPEIGLFAVKLPGNALTARGRNAIFSTDVFCRSELAIHAASPSGSSQAAQLAA